MFKSDVINFYGTKAKVAKAAGVDPSAVSQWQELVPEGRAMRLLAFYQGNVQHFEVTILKCISSNVK
ncbi:Cro/CI family transcriptional regulator [Escherichia coli]